MRKLFITALCILAISGCASTKIAIESSSRVENVQDTIVNNQHTYIKYANFEKLLTEVEKIKGSPLTDEEKVALNAIAVERTDAEKWMIQWERARALRMVTVDSKLYADRSIFETAAEALSKNVEKLLPPASQPAQ